MTFRAEHGSDHVRLIVAADTGGTFTDLAAYDLETGRFFYTKSLTTYSDLVDGVMDCLRKAQVDLRRTDAVKFGTTLVINTFVQRSGARTALITTAGFRDVLEARRGNRPLPFDLRYKRDPILIERDVRFEVRTDHGQRRRAAPPRREGSHRAGSDPARFAHRGGRGVISHLLRKRGARATGSHPAESCRTSTSPQAPSSRGSGTNTSALPRRRPMPMSDPSSRTTLDGLIAAYKTRGSTRHSI
jgi:hypothetical protein